MIPVLLRNYGTRSICLVLMSMSYCPLWSCGYESILDCPASSVWLVLMWSCQGGNVFVCISFSFKYIIGESSSINRTNYIKLCDAEIRTQFNLLFTSSSGRTVEEELKYAIITELPINNVRLARATFTQKHDNNCSYSSRFHPTPTPRSQPAAIKKSFNYAMKTGVDNFPFFKFLKDNYIMSFIYQIDKNNKGLSIDFPYK